MSKQKIRPSQLITTFGPGAIVDLPDDSVKLPCKCTWKALPASNPLWPAWLLQREAITSRVSITRTSWMRPGKLQLSSRLKSLIERRQLSVLENRILSIGSLLSFTGGSLIKVNNLTDIHA